MEGAMYCLRQSDGSFLWRFDAEGGIYASPALDGGVASHSTHTHTHTYVYRYTHAHTHTLTHSLTHSRVCS